MGVDWHKDGYERAKGDTGTGWMAFTCSNLEEMKEGKEDPYEYAEGWFETHQWDYEVGNKISKELDKIGMKKMSEERLDAYLDRREEWTQGYADFISELDTSGNCD